LIKRIKEIGELGWFEIIGHAICHQDETITWLAESALFGAPFVLHVCGLKCPRLIAIGCAVWRDATELASASHQQQAVTQLSGMDIAFNCHTSEQQRCRGVSWSCRLNGFEPLLMNQRQRCRINSAGSSAQDPSGDLTSATRTYITASPRSEPISYSGDPSPPPAGQGHGILVGFM
jgi:hypothetical protein